MPVCISPRARRFVRIRIVHEFGRQVISCPHNGGRHDRGMSSMELPPVGGSMGCRGSSRRIDTDQRRAVTRGCCRESGFFTADDRPLRGQDSRCHAVAGIGVRRARGLARSGLSGEFPVDRDGRHRIQGGRRRDICWARTVSFGWEGLSPPAVRLRLREASGIVIVGTQIFDRRDDMTGWSPPVGEGPASRRPVNPVRVLPAAG